MAERLTPNTNDFVRHLLVTLVPTLGAELKPLLRKALLDSVTTLVDGLVQAGPIRDLLLKAVTDNADAIVDELFAELNTRLAQSQE